jgi:bla regulator protein BlaR1
MKRALAVLVPLLWLADAHAFDVWILVDGDHTTMNGSTGDIDEARSHQRDGEPLLYARRGGKAWVIRDPAEIARARALHAPVTEIGKKMELVGKKMEAVGARQEKVGARMRPLGGRMAELGLELGSLEPDDPRRDGIQAEMERLGDEMEKLGRKMEALGEEMRPHSTEMERLGKHMERASQKAERALVALIEDAIARGVAKPAR